MNHMHNGGSRARETWTRSFAAIKQANEQGIRPWEDEGRPDEGRPGPTFEQWQSILKGTKAGADSERNAGSSVRGGDDAESELNQATPRDEALQELEA